jgi:hypothetical protein
VNIVVIVGLASRFGVVCAPFQVPIEPTMAPVAPPVVTWVSPREATDKAPAREDNPEELERTLQSWEWRKSQSRY